MVFAIRDLLGPSENIPSLPTIFHEINEAVNDARSSMRDIAEIISADQSLSARLLRLVNSAFFGFPSRIETISHAVTIIGTKQLRDLALATTVIEMFKDIPVDLLNVKDFWRHSIASGTASRIFASYHQEPNIERYFVAGLLHDIGRLILYRDLGDHARAALVRCRETGELLHAVERDMFGFDHADVGGALLDHWNLPKSLEESVKYHHRPQRAKLHPLEARTVHIADIFANAMQVGTSGEQFIPPLEGDAWDALGISVSVLAPTSDLLDEQLADAVNLFLGGGV